MNNLNDIFFAPVANQDLTYDQVLEDVQRYFAENHASTIAEAGEGNAERATTLLKELMVQYIVKRKYAIEGLTTEELCEKLYEDMAGYSFLKKWIYKPGIEEVNINAYNDIEVIEAGGRSIKIPDKFSSPQHAIDVVRRMLNACGMVIDDTMPSVVGFLDKNIRISVDKTPIVDPDVGINASIRIVNQQTVSEQKLLDSGSATAEMLHFLMACIRYGVSVCIAGSTGSGKTTIMAWLLSNVPNNQRLITIEEGSREFDLVKRDENGNILNSVIHLLTRPSENPALNINQDFLLERVLRKHPNVIGVGEMRSAAESLSAAESSRTGHTVCTTIHSNSCNSTYRRMMTLAKRKYSMDDAVLMEIMVEAYPILMVFLVPLMVPVLIGLAVALWFSTYYSVFDFVKKRRKLIESEIPRFALTIGQNLENDRDVLKILTSYRRVAGKDFGAELDQTIADMKTGNYENALIRFETRIGSPMLSDVIRGLIGVLRGDDQRMYFKMICFDMRQIEQNNLKKEAAKRPKKIQRYSMMMLICIMIIYLVVLCTEVMSSLGAFFG